MKLRTDPKWLAEYLSVGEPETVELDAALAHALVKAIDDVTANILSDANAALLKRRAIEILATDFGIVDSRWEKT